MSELAWHAVRNDTIRKFGGQTPRAQDETQIIEIFQTLPQLVLSAIDETAELVQNGKVRYGWSFLAARLVRGATPAGDVTVDTGSQRTKKIAAAERWLHNAGLYYDLERDVDDELFNERTGMLKDYATDQALRERLLKRWRDTERPRGEQAETDSLAYQAKVKADLERLERRRTAQPPADDYGPPELIRKEHAA